MTFEEWWEDNYADYLHRMDLDCAMHLAWEACAEEYESKLAEARLDTERINGLARLAAKYRIEFARSLLKAGFEIGIWSRPINVIVRNGDIRNVIDAALEAERD